jgi:uncharacterized repeat protein (TIGR03803 family)
MHCNSYFSNKRILVACFALAVIPLALLDVAHAKGLATVYSFTGGKSDGQWPYAQLVADKKGNLYGTTENGGAHQFGTVFKLSPKGKETILHTFAGGSNDGAYPYAGVIMDGAGNLYGTTELGGASNLGTVFRLATDGTVTVLHSFAGAPNDGAQPYAAVISDSGGDLYGTTSVGGTSNVGTVFKLAADGTESVLYSFAGGSDGANPMARLLRDSSGNLYGTTYMGGGGFGAVFKVASNGTETLLHEFDGTDGFWPAAGLIADSQGNLYGTTSIGGTAEAGVIFKIAPDDTETTVHNFAGYPSDGDAPTGDLIEDKSGNLYGTTSAGGSNYACETSLTFGCGTIFKFAPDGTLTLLYGFPDANNGETPNAGLFVGKKKELYGTTAFGGNNNCASSNGSGCGTVFKIKE